jgi:hypothetical protein
MTDDADDDTLEQIAEYCRKNPDVLEGPTSTHALADGEVYRISTHPKYGIDVIPSVDPDLIKCPHCGEITIFQMGRTPCCGELSDPHRYGGGE